MKFSCVYFSYSVLFIGIDSDSLQGLYGKLFQNLRTEKAFELDLKYMYTKIAEKGIKI